MRFLPHVSPHAGAEDSDTLSSPVRSLIEVPVCRDCQPRFEGSREFMYKQSDVGSVFKFHGLRSEFAHVTKKTAESCSLCFCVHHLVPFDLPESTEIGGGLRQTSLQPGKECFSGELMAGRDRVLGTIKISHQDAAQHYEPATTADFQAISQLLAECEENHNHHNWDLSRYQSPIDIHLIDVESLMIVAATTQYRYLALRYVWGEHDSFATTTKTIKSLGRKGGLGKYMNEIPKTIKDAMDVVRKIGERYLWVDRLCIEQDNAAQKEGQIQKMDVVYSQALITIIAHAGASATSPLPGVRPGTRLELPVTHLGDFTVSFIPPGLWESGAPHETRGWTLQEQLMSKRCLYFDYHTTWFQCDRGLRREITAAEGQPYALLRPPASFDLRYLQSMMVDVAGTSHFENAWKAYASIVERYRTRELRYAEDTIRAIQGVTQVISDLLDVPLISTVPLSMLPRALQFSLTWPGFTFERNETAPSWSWAGWKEPVDYDNEYLAYGVPVRKVKSEMMIKFPAGPPIKAPDQSLLQPANSEAAHSTEKSNVQAPLYMILDIKCFSTKASAFRVGAERGAKKRKTVLEDRFSIVFEVYGQGGSSCGTSLGRMPNVLDEDYNSDDLQWILLSTSHFAPVSLG